MATLQEVETDIKTIAANITAFKTSGAAKADPATLQKHVVRERPYKQRLVSWFFYLQY